MTRNEFIMALLAAGAYEVKAQEGIVRRLRERKGYRLQKSKPIAVDVDRYGYEYFGTTFAGHKKNVAIHRLIWMSVHGTVPDGLMIDHIDRDTRNNRISNLRLVDCKGNAQNRRSYKGANHPQLKFTDARIVEWRRAAARGERVSDIARREGAHYEYVRLVVRGKRRVEAGA